MLLSLAATNTRAWLTTAGAAVGFLGFCGAVGRSQLLPRRLARKLMHIGTGPLFMLCMPLYSAAPVSRWLAASVPALAGVQFALVGAGLLRNDSLVAGSSRTGHAEELLRGPLYYAIVHVGTTLLCWRHSPAGILALAVLCGGDGLAEVAGRGAGPRATRLPHNPDKTVAGSLACWLGGAATALPLLVRFRNAGMFAGGGGAAALHGWQLAARVLLCAGVGAAAESLPIGRELDNFSVPIATAIAARLAFGF